MSEYQIVNEGFDPTSVSTPTNSQLLQMVRELQFVASVGGVILSDSAPDVATYPDLARFLWHDLTGVTRTGELHYHDGSTWLPVIPKAGSLNGAMFSAGTIDYTKLSCGVGGNDKMLVGNASEDGFDLVTKASLFPAHTFPVTALEAEPGPNDRYFLLTDANGWLEFVDFDVNVNASLLTFLTSATTIDLPDSMDADYLLLYASTANAMRRITPRGLLRGLFESTTSDPEKTTTLDTDALLLWDGSEATVSERIKYVTLANLLPDMDPPVTPSAYTNPTVTVNAKGLITAIASNAVFTSALIAIPASGNAIAPQAHGITGGPKFVSVYLVAANAPAATFTTDDRIPVSMLERAVGSDNDFHPFSVTWDDTYIYVGFFHAGDATKIHIVGKDGSGSIPTEAYIFDPVDWQIRISAM